MSTECDLFQKQEHKDKPRKLILGAGRLVCSVLLLLVFMCRYRSRSQKNIREKKQQLFIKEKEQLQQSEKIKHIEGVHRGRRKGKKTNRYGAAR